MTTQQLGDASPAHKAPAGKERRAPRPKGITSALRRARAALARPLRAALRRWAALRPPQQLVLGFGLYVALGVLVLSLPWARQTHVSFIDNLFNVVSAVSTTGLTTISVADSYTALGEFTILILFQLGGIGYMTVSSVLVLATGRTLSTSRLGVLRAGFAVPHYFVMQHFLVQVVVFTAVCEGVGTAILWWRFAALGVENPLWSAAFHAVSAFTTAGFSLNNSGLEAFRSDWVVNLVVGTLCYLGAIGFIVVQDVWYSAKLRERLLTFTSKVILWTTLIVFLAATPLLVALEPSIAALPFHERLLAAAFQTMTASSTAGFNTIPIGAMAPPALFVLLICMLIGASPSGTGGGLKTTTISAIFANLLSVLRGRSDVALFGREIPLVRVLWAFAAASIYLVLITFGVLILCVTEHQDFIKIVFETASAIGTVGLSMGITPELTTAGKITLIVLMFAGRCGPLTIGLCLLRPGTKNRESPTDDLAV